LRSKVLLLSKIAAGNEAIFLASRLLGSIGYWVNLVFSCFNYVVIPKGVSEPRVFISGRVALRDPRDDDSFMGAVWSAKLTHCQALLKLAERRKLL